MKNIRYYVYWLLDIAKGRVMSKNCREIADIMAADSESVKKWQLEKLTKLLDAASKHCEYYKEYSRFKSIQECPVIDKGTIKENYDLMLSDNYKKEDLHKMSTSGSTGTPFEILQNKEKRIRLLAELIYFNRIIGQNVGDKFIYYRVWNEKNKKSRLEQIKQNLLPIDILRLDKDNLKYIVDILLKDKKIKSTLAYASTYDMILSYIKDNNITGNFNLKAMVSSSEVLSETTLKGLEESIGCRVVDRYSNQEGGVLAQSNLEHRELIVNNASYYLEVLKLNSDEPVEIGEVGRIVITDLFNYSMPLIRYDTGDLGIISHKSEEIGYCLESIQGRQDDVIYDTSGRIITSHAWGLKMCKYNKLKQFQFIQEEQKKYVLKVNGAEGIYQKEDFDKTLREVLGDDADISIEFVNEIPVLASGKFKRTVCRYSPDRQ